MKSTSLKLQFILLLALITIVFIFGITQGPPSINNYTQYDCDVKNLRLSTDIQIRCNSEKIGSVTGNIFRIVEDPLTMNDTDGNKVAYAGDDYHFISQDSHSIVIGDTVTAEMVGLVTIFGEKYDIYNTDGEKIAYAKFNELNTAGEIRDADGTLIATYGSFVFFNDFTVKISNESEIEPNTLLMIICSYYSDQNYDN